MTFLQSTSHNFIFEIHSSEYIPTSKTSLPRKIFNWILSGDDYSWSVDNVKNEDKIDFTETDDEETFLEGQEKYRIHKIKERNKALVELKKRNAFKLNANLPCEICNLSFREEYGEIGVGFIEAHHIIPISQLNDGRESKLEDLILICSNCHKMIHRRRPWLSIEEIKALIKK